MNPNHIVRSQSETDSETKVRPVRFQKIIHVAQLDTYQILVHQNT